MAELTARYTVNKPHVVHDTIDGETILVNLKNGKYYSFLNSGVVIWDLITNEFSPREMISQISELYKISQIEIENSLLKFVDRLIEEGLIVPKGSGSGSNEVNSNGEMHNVAIDIMTSYEEPVLNVYADMEDMLLLDPIHDTDEEGWPSGKDE